ncbi:MAG: hypothetical protein U0736_04875 [Gemmataceae bacterium]
MSGLIGTMLAGEVNKAGVPAILGPNSLVFRFPAGYNQAAEFVQRPDRLARIEEALRRLTAKSWTIRVEVAPQSATPLEPAERTPKVGSRARGNAREEAEKVPLVRRAVEVLGAAVQRVDDGFGEAPEQPER